MSRLDRLARALVRCYPRAWRVRYEEEFVALLEQTDASWRLVLDILSSVAKEHIRRTLGSAFGLAAPLPWPYRRSILIGAALLAGSWFLGRVLDPFVEDSEFITGPQILLPYMATRWAAALRAPAAPAPPVYLSNPFRPGQLLQLSVPRWMSPAIVVLRGLMRILRVVLYPLSALPVRYAAAAAGLCLVAYGVLTGIEPFVFKFSHGAELLGVWFLGPIIFLNWLQTVADSSRELANSTT